MRRHYRTFAAMIATSTVVMFGLMYLNTLELDHVFFSQTRAWMALVMATAMAAIMLGFMRGMYPTAASTPASPLPPRWSSSPRSGWSGASGRWTTCPI